MHKPSRGGNVVIKLDMTKAYDKISWSFFGTILKKLGLNDQWVNLIHDYNSHNQYFVLINGRRRGFFSICKGSQIGDPLSLSLFVLNAEILSLMMTNPHNTIDYNSFYMKTNCPKVNHLCFVYDTILFCNRYKRSM